MFAIISTFQGKEKDQSLKEILTRARFGPKLITRLIKGVGVDVDDEKGVTFVGQIIYGPFQSVLAAL